MSSYLITGAGRGIGLELTKQLAQQDQSKVSRIIATNRGQPSSALSDLVAASDDRVVFVSCDVTDAASVEKAVELIAPKLDRDGLDVLINNAGTQTAYPDGICSMPDDQFLQNLDINVVSVHRITSALLPLLRKGTAKKIVNMYAQFAASMLMTTNKQLTIITRSSTLGSISYAPNFAFAPLPAYKVTKAALNMLTVQYAQELAKDGFTILAVSPGWLKTDLGSSYADLEVESGVRATLEVIFNASPASNGKFLNVHVPDWEEAEIAHRYDGDEIPW
ncbi:hypothetical protein ACLMJK_008157 [Lecanora helva]